MPEARVLTPGYEAVDSLWLSLTKGNDLGGGQPVLTGPSFVDSENISPSRSTPRTTPAEARRGPAEVEESGRGIVAVSASAGGSGLGSGLNRLRDCGPGPVVQGRNAPLA